MADNDQSKIRYDDFVSAVQPDPAKPQATIMLAGFLGHGPDGQVRIYPDPTLGNWYDVAEGDVVHSMPIADAKLGGSYIWVRDSAQIKPGSAAAAAPAAQPQAVAAADPPQTGVQDCTLAFCNQNQNQNPNQPTPQTHCFICPPLTIPCQVQTQHCTPATICTLHGQCPPQTLHCPTHPVVCDIPPHQTLATVCTQIGCPTQPVVCGILPPSFNCTQQGCGQAGQQPGGQVQAQALAAAPGPAMASQFLCTPFQGTCAAPQGAAAQQPLTQGICATPSVFQQCGAPPPFSQHICPTPSAVNQCGPPPFSQHICPTPSAVHQCGGAHPTLATLCTQPHLCPLQAPGAAFFSWPAFCTPQCQPAPQAAMAGPPGTAMFSWPAQCPSQFCSAVGTCGQAPQGPQMQAQPMAGPPGTAMFYCTMNCGAQMQPQAMAAAPAPMASQLLCTPFDGCAAPQAAAAVQPTPSAVHQCGQPLTQGICPTPSAINQCGQPLTQGICPTPSAINLCGQPFTQGICPTLSAINQCGQPLTQGICPTLSAIHLCGQPLTQAICATPTATQPGFCQPTGIACLATQGCMTAPNGVFTPFGR